MREEKEEMPQATLFSGVHFGGGHGTLNEGWCIRIGHRLLSQPKYGIAQKHTLQSRLSIHSGAH